MADFVLPLACVDEFGSGEEAGPLGQPGEGVEGVERMLAPAPLLPNLGKASAHAYWMDLTVSFILSLLVFCILPTNHLELTLLRCK